MASHCLLNKRRTPPQGSPCPACVFPCLSCCAVWSRFCFLPPWGSTLSLNLKQPAFRQTLHFSLLLSFILGVSFLFIFLIFSYQNPTHPLEPKFMPSTKKSSFKLPICILKEGSYSSLSRVEHNLWIQRNVSLNLGCAPLEKLSNLSDPQFPHLWTWDK